MTIHFFYKQVGIFFDSEVKNTKNNCMSTDESNAKKIFIDISTIYVHQSNCNCFVVEFMTIQDINLHLEWNEVYSATYRKAMSKLYEQNVMHTA